MLRTDDCSLRGMFLPAEVDYRLAGETLARRDIPAALRHIHRAERNGYDPDLCAACRWSCWMLLGRFDLAWRESDRIARRGRPDPYRLWDGAPLISGKRVLIRCLHGYGDAIQFSRYTCWVRSEAASVIVQTHPELVSLLRGLRAVDEVITWESPSCPAPPWDRQIEVMELPRMHGTTLDTIPCEVPYLFVPPARQRQSRIPPPDNHRLRVGLQWRSGAWNPARSLDLSALRPILEHGEFEFYNFQRGTSREEAHALLEWRVADVSGDSPEIVEAAADLMRVDLLITVDTMLAHLAGALGRPVWVLLPFEADWRWMLDRSDSPWYPTMRLFRQPSPGNWHCPVSQIVHALTALR
uniref:TPR repeat protein n=1 Tax=Solibacter usitatus (strain Ellin6076) TaxID=234267 RepID=Q022U5_SOLUE